MARSSDMSCQEFAERLTAYLDDALDPANRDRLEAHGRECADCRAHLAEMRLVMNSLQRLGHEPPADLAADKERMLGLFRSRRPGPHARREPSLPLGIGDTHVALGDHVAYLWESEQEFAATAGFLVAGLERDEVGVLVGHEAANNRVLASLEQRGLHPERLSLEDRLHVVSSHRSGDTILRYLDDRIKAAVDRGALAIRILGSLGWGQPGWASDRDLLAMEAQTADILKRLPTVVLCASDVGGIPGRILRKGGLACDRRLARHTT